MDPRAWLLPVPADRRPRRLGQLVVGLALYGAGQALLVVAGIGVDPWDVLHQGLSRTVGGQIGTWTNLLGAVVLLAWIPLRQRPGVGTVANVLLVGTSLNLTLLVLPHPTGLPLQLLTMVAGVALVAVATATYIGAGLGPGPRDGLMTGIAARGHSVRVVRTGLELAVLLTGWLLGGTVGAGTVVFAVGIGPAVHVLLPLLRVGGSRPAMPGPAADDVGAGVVSRSVAADPPPACR